MTHDNYNSNEKTFRCLAQCPELMEFLSGKVIWDPFFNDGAVLSVLKKSFPESKIIHKDEDFFKVNKKKKYDIIISNPPFSQKKEILEVLVDSKKPFCLVLPLDVLARKYFSNHYKDQMDKVHIIIPKEVSSMGFGDCKSTPRWMWGWFCYNIPTFKNFNNIIYL